ncbi:hypothetical protein J2W14_001664 [Pseudarthrobacter oxydans]|nr:hypothetical protein [Pseudarthrobacter oxydans]MDP9982276.1 hypothetical protein [Pseudarthrobacter oxydans]
MATYRSMLELKIPHTPGSILDGCFPDDREPDTGPTAGPRRY